MIGINNISLIIEIINYHSLFANTKSGYAYVSAGGDIQVDFKMPKEAVVGSTIDLRCEWRILGGSGLYSVKWYKDDHEFFRFLPDSSQRTQIFPRPGVKVEVCFLIYVCYVEICIIICVSLCYH